MSHGSMKRTDSVEMRALTVVTPRKIISTMIMIGLSEDKLQSVLNLPVADVAGGVGHTKPGVASCTGLDSCPRCWYTMENTVGDCPVVSSKVVVCTPEHGVIQQIEELQAELNSSLLT